MGFDVPVSIGVAGVVLLSAGDLNLLETPLRKIAIAGSQIATEAGVLQSECRCQSANLAAVTRSCIADNLNLPMVLIITNSQVAIGRDFIVLLPHRGSDLVGVEVSTSLRMEESDCGTIAWEAKLVGFRIVLVLAATGVEEPVVVRVLVVVTCDLLLLGAFGIGLDM